MNLFYEITAGCIDTVVSISVGFTFKILKNKNGLLLFILIFLKLHFLIVLIYLSLNVSYLILEIEKKKAESNRIGKSEVEK